ncbi:TPA: hypothetical protein ACKRBA_001119 [Streptococcus pyogenes]|uniref:hypothetical protein n=1 Tax=Streptococcus pyogenes TaxID=1314 RepID=UPI00101384A4|nr:hypothetical protein [Streptococcus pyogenes]QAX70464.1 hypothetical protein EB817_01055 [Streptococcus pyogenes]HEQ3712595.1 hypothetical protein [Streptococcus pyogenes]HEQ3833841.1 hypothetical protein [Streptococcus pyogenes]HEQ9731338.1 hypothetical protein [Streptococcus pyogenes]HEQ9743616.1 hypothetical protein [Streptococcus pyogenes]
MKQQSYQPLRFVYLLVALFAAMLLIARPVMADEDNDPWKLGYNQGLTKGKEDGKDANWTDLTPPDPTTIPEPPNNIEETTNKQHYKEGYTDGYKDGYKEGFGGSYPLLIPVQFIWGIILHWWGKLS